MALFEQVQRHKDATNAGHESQASKQDVFAVTKCCPVLGNQTDRKSADDVPQQAEANFRALARTGRMRFEAGAKTIRSSGVSGGRIERVSAVAHDSGIRIQQRALRTTSHEDRPTITRSAAARKRLPCNAAFSVVAFLLPLDSSDRNPPARPVRVRRAFSVGIHLSDRRARPLQLRVSQLH